MPTNKECYCYWDDACTFSSWSITGATSFVTLNNPAVENTASLTIQTDTPFRQVTNIVFTVGVLTSNSRSVAMTIVVCGNEVLTAPYSFDATVELLMETGTAGTFHDITSARILAMFDLTHDVTLTHVDCIIKWYDFFSDNSCLTPLSHS